MIELKTEQYPILWELFGSLRYNLVVDSVLEGNTPARVFTDRLSAPSSGLIWDRQDAVLVSGRPDDSMWTIIETDFIPDARRRWIPELSIFYPTEAWLALIMQRLQAFRPEMTGRRYYRFDKLRLSWREALPEGYGLRRIDPTLLENTELMNVGEMAGWVNSFWASPEEFARIGFGYCALSDDSVSSWCLTVFAAGEARELGVATVLDQRGKGLATAVSAACVEHCLDHGYQPHWHCLDENIPSWAMAEKLGFVDPVAYQVVRIRI